MTDKQREMITRFLAEPTDVNFGGKVHGGMVMKWIDQAAYACAVNWSSAYCVTVAVGGIQFVKPVLIGDLVSVKARLVHTGTSSMYFTVDVRTQDLKSGHTRLATSCVIMFVALDAPDGKPTPVPSCEPRTEEERKLAEYAKWLVGVSKNMESMMVSGQSAAHGDPTEK